MDTDQFNGSGAKKPHRKNTKKRPRERRPKRKKSPNNGFVEGIVTKVVGRRGYGFAKRPDTGVEVYFRLDKRCRISRRGNRLRFADVIKHPDYPKVGDTVTFRLNTKAPKKKPRATVWGIFPEDCLNLGGRNSRVKMLHNLWD